MAWNRRYSFLSYVKSSLWIVPVIALLSEMVMKRLSEQLGAWMVGQGFYDLQTSFLALNAAGAEALLERIFTLSLSCLVFTFGSLLVAIQVAGGQYTPRIIATTLLRDNVIRSIVGLFIFTMLWANRTAVQIGQGFVVPQFQVFLAAIFGLAALIAFIILIDYSAKLLRPVSLVRRIGEQGIAVIGNVYPDLSADVSVQAAPTKKTEWHLLPQKWRGEITFSTSAGNLGKPDRVVYHKGKSSIVLAVNLQKLFTAAKRADCTIEFAAQVGDFVGSDEPLFYIYGKVDAIDDRRLANLVALGSERTMEQDPMFAFRIESDIALKALSPAINDPTTAVLAIDQLQRLLALVGKRSLRGHEIKDETGRTRIVFHTPNWEDFVHISFREIRHYGAGNMQIARRLHAMIEHLIMALPEHRHPALRVEMDLLNRAIAKELTFVEDVALAGIPDTQGLGGAYGDWYRHDGAVKSRV